MLVYLETINYATKDISVLQALDLPADVKSENFLSK